jgi:integrase
MALTDVRVRTAKPATKPYKLTDGRGLYLLIMPSGSKLWRVKFRHVGKEKLLAVGAYPDVSLSAARKARDQARELLAKGDDPSLTKRREKVRKAAEAEDTFAAVANELLAKFEREGMEAVTISKKRWLLSLLSDLGGMAVADIEPADILAPLRKIERRGNHETARRALQFTGQTLRYAIATARLRSDPSRDLKGALTAPRVRHHPAIVDPERLGELLRAIDGYSGRPSTKLALQIAPHVFVRPGELRHADWSEFNLEQARWAIPAARMKMRREHVVPLSTQVVNILKQVPKSKRSGLVFKASGAKPLCENTLNLALRRLGFGQDEMTSHGFRATASTLLNESGMWSPDAIERALAHGDNGSVRAAYHRGAHWQERVQMAQWWSDYLDTLKSAQALKEAA